MSQCNIEIYRTKRQTEYNYQRQRDRFCCSWRRVFTVSCGMEQRKDWRTSNSTRNQMEVQPTRSNFTLEEFGNGWWEVAIKQCMPCWWTDQSPRTFLQQRCVLLSRHYTQDFWLQSVQTFAYPTYRAPKKFLTVESSLAYSNLIWDRFCEEYLPTLNNRQKWQSTANEIFKEGDLIDRRQQ